MNTDAFRQLIEKDFPELQIKDIKYLGSGWDNAAILVNGEYVFRFLRGIFDKNYPLKTEDIEKEVTILNYLQKMVSFQVPKPAYWTHDYTYFGYKLIAGTLWDQAGEPLSEDYLKSWVITRSEISKKLDAKDASKLGVPHYRTEKNENFVNEFLSDPSADERVKQLAKQAMDYVCTRCTPTDNWVFIHEDLQMSNCMVDPDMKQITGVIDWLEAEVGPVEAEFYFWSKYNNGLLEKMAKLQEEHDGTKIDVRLARAIHQFYIVADYQDYKARGFDQAAAHKWRQIESYL